MGQLFVFLLLPLKNNSNKKKKDNVLHERWHKNHDKNKCRRVGVGNRQNLVWPPELVNFACGGGIVMDDAGLMLPAGLPGWLPGIVRLCLHTDDRLCIVLPLHPRF